MIRYLGRRAVWLAALMVAAVLASLLGVGKAHAAYGPGPSVPPTLTVDGSTVIVKASGGASFCPSGYRVVVFVWVDATVFGSVGGNSDGSFPEFEVYASATSTGTRAFQVSCMSAASELTFPSPPAYACDLGSTWSLGVCSSGGGATVTATATVTGPPGPTVTASHTITNTAYVNQPLPTDEAGSVVVTTGGASTGMLGALGLAALVLLAAICWAVLRR